MPTSFFLSFHSWLYISLFSPSPDWTFHNFSVSKYVDWYFLCSLQSSNDGFWDSKNVKMFGRASCYSSITTLMMVASLLAGVSNVLIKISMDFFGASVCLFVCPEEDGKKMCFSFSDWALHIPRVKLMVKLICRDFCLWLEDVFIGPVEIKVFHQPTKKRKK